MIMFRRIFKGCGIYFGPFTCFNYLWRGCGIVISCYPVILTFFLHLDSSTVSTWTWIFFKPYTFFLLAKDVLLFSTILILVPSGQEIIF